MGSLKTFELSINERSEKKSKSIAFKSNTKEKDEEYNLDTEEEMTKTIAHLGRQFNRVMKIMEGSSRSNVRNIPHDINRTSNSGKKTEAEERPAQGIELRCYEYGGFGHIKWDCPNYLKRQDKD